MNLYLLQMSIGLKYQASIVVLLVLLLAHADGTILMPLCDVCATSNATNCLTCRTAKLFATIVSGIPQCISGYYMNQVNPASIFCAPCFAGCTKCTGPLATNCVTCAYAPMQLCAVCATDDCTNCLTCHTLKPNAIMSSGSIICATGFYRNQADTANHICSSCNAACRKCTGPLSTNCVACPLAPMPLCNTCATDNCDTCLTCQTAKTFATVYDGIAQCITGYYKNQANPSNIICSPCSAGCSKCTGPLAGDCLPCTVDPMPLCAICAANDCTSCLSCQTAKAYAIVTNGFTSCAAGYYSNQDNPSNIYCDRCHSSCKRCFGPLASNCLSCSDRFDYNQTGSVCVAPNNSTDQTLIEAYSFYGFSFLSGWNYPPGTAGPSSTYCDGRSILGGNGVTVGGQAIQVTYSTPNIPYHYELRVKMAFYIINNGGSTAQAWVRVTPSTPIQNKTYSLGTSSINKCSYPSGPDYIHFNIDDTFLHSATTATVQIGLTQAQSFGIREFYLIAKKCKAQNCSLCTGYEANQCTECVDSNVISRRVSTNTVAGGTCLCTGIYFQEPYAGECVDPCPSVPIQHYGDPLSRFCRTTCPAGYFALDDNYRCVLDCPATSAITTLLLFRDNINRKCVSRCPDTEPYAYPLSTDRNCYATCPSGTFATDAKDRRCVATCPYNTTYKLYAHINRCVAACPVGLWADPHTISCIANCSSTAYPFKDNSTGTGVCVSMCPAPNFFGQTVNHTCVETCPNDTYGQIYDSTNVVMIQKCVTICNSPRWGLLTDNRKCVDFCPQNTWGELTFRTCTSSPANCGTLFANNATRTCVAALSCSYGFYGDDTSRLCVPYCPSDRLAHPDTKLCQTSCATPYFADPGMRMCVTACNTTGLYADIDSSRTCVENCNSTANYPWADDSTRTCVSDCNNTVANLLSDNSTFKCVYHCPPNRYADWTTTAPKCVPSCPANHYASNSTGTGVCVQTCSAYPRKFGDVVGGLNLCVDVCRPSYFGYQTGNRLCNTACTGSYFAQNDAQRLCVLRCKAGTYGSANVCLPDPKQCPTGQFGDDSTNLCVPLCPASQGTFGDPQSKLCVRMCPVNPNHPTSGPEVYFADISNRLCVLTCNATHSGGLFGNNNTRTCETKCLDRNAYAQTQTTNRLCVAVCRQTPDFRYANNDTKVCGTSLMCQLNYFGENTTQICVEFCPTPSFAYKTATHKYCIDQCPLAANSVDWYGDITTGKRICVSQCPSLPLRFADPTTKLCVQTCPGSLYGDITTRKCVPLCPPTYFAHLPTKQCTLRCPSGFFGDDTASTRFCHPNSGLCGTRFGDPFKNLCVSVCTGPTPVSYFGSGDDCVLICPNGTYADSDTGTRLCVADCPDRTAITGGRDLYGDPLTRTCEPKCIQPLTWADSQTRDCQSVCSAVSIPTYSQNFNMRCVTAMNCPTTPSMTFGDNSTRSCLGNCSDDKFGHPLDRNCLTRCPSQAITLTEHYYGAKSTGINLCVTVCPSTPRLFGDNGTNLCVPECPAPYYGDQTGKRSCLDQCPIVSSVYYYSQNESRICVTVCKTGTWGRQSSRQCVEDSTLCGSQWANNITNMCVTTCPATSGLYADPTTRFCVPLCPANYYSDDSTRTCVQRCPSTHGPLGTFGNNATRVCEENCQEPNAFADPQTVNRYCVLLCSQSTNEAFADPSTKTCVSRCPVFPSLFAETQGFKCVQKCVTPYFANTNTRRCELTCPGQFKLNGSQLCVTTCPQNPDLYADTLTGFCQSTCSSSQHRFPTDRTCIASCKVKGLFMHDFTCVKFCPFGLYADASGICVSTCPSSTYGENTTTECLGTCLTGYAQGSLCVAKCNDGLFGENFICKSGCTAPARASNQTNLCVSMCEAGTYLLNGKCELACTTGYADPALNECKTSCSNGRFADPTTNKCVETCPAGYYRDATGFCLNDCSPNSRRADNITWNCESQCSNGSWGSAFNCVNKCPPLSYGYTVNRDCYTIPNRPSTTLFADNNTQTWVTVCPLSPLTFGDRTKKECVPSCISGQFTDPSSRQCQTACTNLSYFADTTTGKCLLICSTGFFANTLNNKCEDICTGGKFAYTPTNQCVGTCPAPYYGYNNGAGTLTCVLKCPTNFYAEGRLCVSGCSVLFADTTTNMCVASCLNSFANTATRKCEPNCVSVGKISDNSSNTCVTLCPTDPDFYEENSVCVPHCSAGLFADPTAGLRGCRSGCTEGLWAQPESQRCLPTCKPGYFGRNFTNSCHRTCLPGEFADLSTGFCQTVCPAPTFADSLLHACVQTCSGNQWGQGRVCVPVCAGGSFSNPLTRTCESSCPQFDYLFAENTTHSCVKDCKIVTNSFADKSNRKCMGACSLTLEYALVSEGRCVSLCPEGLFMDNSTKRCDATCTLGFAEPTSRYCVLRCFGAPDTYGYTDANSVKTCKYKCKENGLNLYADNRTNLCVATCLDPMFSDPLTGNCVLFCPEGYYAEDTTRTCSTTCNTTQFADNFTRRCVNECPTATQWTYGFLGNNTCMRVCPTGYFARNDTKQCVLPAGCAANSWADPISKYCVSRCPSDPLSFGYDTDKTCVPVCPKTGSEDLFGEFDSQRCFPNCYGRNNKPTYADSHTRTCVFRCPIEQQLWADTTDGICKRTCSGSQIRDNSTQTCVATCPSDPMSYANTVTLFCVRKCPNGTYASDSSARVCTTDCSAYSLTYADNITNRCTNKCPIPYYADNTTYLCVLNCPSGVDYYADPHSQTCVKNCPSGTGWVSFADPTPRACVTRCTEASYAVNSTQRCVPRCPSTGWADEQLNLCVENCTVRPGLYKEQDTQKCQPQCPNVPVKAYKYQPDNICVYSTGVQSGCPTTYFANPLNDMCTERCPAGYFAEDSSKMCVPTCQVDFVADPTDRRCKSGCTLTPEYYAYDLHKVCVQHCPAPYFKNNQTYRCTLDCTTSPLMFRYEQTRQCVQSCHYPFFAYTPNRTCLASCPDGWFAQQSTKSCVQTCNNPYFADNSTNQCVEVCPSNPDFYGHLKICVFFCPANFYRDNTTRKCVESCPIQPLTFADNSTNTCVKVCPADQNFFADNVTRKCVLNCSPGLFSQVNSRTCLKTCPKNIETYADPTTRVCKAICPDTYYASEVTKECVKLCPDEPVKTYAHIKKCLERCPQNYFGENVTRTCRLNCSDQVSIYADNTTNLCVTNCPVGLFAENVTKTCVNQCPKGSFADPTTRICVAKCPGTERLFADPSNQQCVTQCSPLYYGNSIDWVCLLSCPESASGYRLEVGRLCVAECPSPYFAFESTRLCVTNCGKGLYGDPVTRTCKACPSECPTCLSPSNCLTCISTKYLSYGACVDQCILTDEVANYANDETRSCVIPTRCPDGRFGLNSTKKCTINCDLKQYKNATLRRCESCPQYCTACSNLTHCSSCTSDAVFASQDNFCYPYCNATHKYYLKNQCTQKCSEGTYLDYTAVNCEACNEICLTCSGNALNCTSCYQSFKLQGKCLSTCPADYYAENGQCKACTPEIESCVTPLSFDVKQTTENFQPVLVVKFNQEIKVNGDPKNFVKVRLSMKSRRRRLSQTRALQQSQANLINDGMEFEAQVLPDGTMKLKLNPGMSLENVKFEVVFTDAGAIQTPTGQGLQSLVSEIQIQSVEVYPAGTLAQATSTFELFGLLLSVAMVIPVFFLLLCSPVAVFQQLQAFQLISLFAYFSELPPNLFFFLKKLKFSRFTFLSSIFAGVYEEPSTFSEKIPVNVAETEGQLSFAKNAGGFMIFAFVYAVIWAIVYVGSSKVNGNRPLRNIFIEVYKTRVKYGLVHDFLWIFSINIFASAFMQFRYTDNKGDTALGAIFMLVFTAGIGYMIHKLRQYHETAYEEKQLKLEQRANMSFYIEGLKQTPWRQHMPSVYYVRKILFALIIAAVIKESLTQAIILVILQLFMCIYLLAMRPYVDNFRNVLHFLNEFGIGFVPCGIIYFIKIREMKEPIGHRIICGQIISYVIIGHLCILLIWAYARAYFFLKELWKAFKETEFYTLYMDEEYESELEKQIRELDDENGEVESVEITNYNDKERPGEDDEGDQVIKLKIKRRRIKGKNPVEKELINEPKRHDKAEYTKLEDSAEETLKSKPVHHTTDYQKMKISEPKDQIESLNDNIQERLIVNPNVEKIMRKSIHDEEWVAVKYGDDKSEKDEAKWAEIEHKQNMLTKDQRNKFQELSYGFISQIHSETDEAKHQLAPPLIQHNISSQQESQERKKSEEIFDMIESDQEDQQQNNPSSGEFQQIKKSDQKFSDLNINVQNQEQEYEHQDFENGEQNDGWIPSNQAALKSKAKTQKQVKTVKLDEIPMSESKFESEKPKKEINNWGELQGILEDEDDERKEEKKKIQMMIFDEEDFESEQN